MYTPSTSPRLRAIGSCTNAAHCVHKACGAFQRKGGFTGAVGVDVFSGIPGRFAITRFVIIVKASRRAGPHGEGVAALLVLYSWVFDA